MKETFNQPQNLDNLNANQDIFKSKWLLLKRDKKYKIYRNRWNIILFFIFVFVPFWALLDILFNKQWKWFFLCLFSAICSVLFAGSVDYGVMPAVSSITVMSIFVISWSVARTSLILIKLMKQGWQVVAGSSAFRKSVAINEWKDKNIDVGDPYGNPRLPY